MMASLPGAGEDARGGADQVRAMFGRVARRYDLANTLLSLGRDGAWRREAARATGLREGQAGLDVACGTGRLALELKRLVGPSGRVVGVDFSPAMLDLARRATPAVDWREADALDLPFAGGAFDAATVAFGMRNLVDPRRGAAEMARVVRPGGRLVVLEFVRPPAGLAGAAYRVYLERVLPTIGGWLTGEGTAYRYLARTVGAYLSAPELSDLVAGAGWRSPSTRLLNRGTVALIAAQSGPPLR